MKSRSKFLNYIKLSIFLILAIQATNCLYNTEYAKSWKWESQSTYVGSKYHNQFTGHHYGSIYANLPLGIEVKDDGTLWSVEIEQFNPSYYVCFGLQDITNWAYTSSQKDTHWYNFSIMACTNRSNFEHLGSSIYIHSPFDYKKEHEGKYDMILTNDKFIITNENYGRHTNIEFTIDSSLKYYPVIQTYTNSYAPHLLYKLNFNSCFWRCDTCDDWNFTECKTCKSDPNNLPAPSCECKPGYTHYYNNQANLACQTEPNYYKPNPTEWQWTSNYDDTHLYTDNLELGYKKFDVSQHSEVNLGTDGIIVQDDGIKWTLELVDNNDSGDMQFCFGIQDVSNNVGTSLSTNANTICSKRAMYESRKATGSTTVINGKLIAFAGASLNQKFDMIFTDTYFTITTVPYHGTLDVKYEYNQDYKYRPVYYSEAQGTVRVGACSPRCSTCAYMEPEQCIVCSDAVNRGSAPECPCNSGKQDTFRFPDIHSIQDTCIDNYEFHEPAPPEWVWKSESTQITEEKPGTFTTLNGYSHLAVELGNKGIIVLKDGIKWQIKILNHEAGSSNLCFGIQKVERQFNRNWTTSTARGNFICTSGTHRQDDAFAMKQVYEQIPIKDASTGHIFDLVYRYGSLYISNEEHGGNVRFEFELDQNLNFAPYIYAYSENIIQKQTIQVQGCSHRCLSCAPFEPNNCNICNDQVNRPSAPQCECKALYEDFYDMEYHKECRKKPTWEEPTYPEWIWHTNSDYVYEDIDHEENIYNKGVFISKSTNHNTITLKDNTILKPYQKWTVKILQHNSVSRVCMGVWDVISAESPHRANNYSNQVSQCTDAVTTVYQKDATSTYTGNIRPRAEQTGAVFDLYYYGDRLIITDKDQGGYFERIFTLDPSITYIPTIDIYGTKTKIQVKGCSDRCNTCQDWEPETCLSCNDSPYRIAAPECFCEQTYEDLYDGQLQKTCRQVEVYNDRKPPEWNWQVYGLYAQEDINDKKENYGTFTSINSYSTLGVKDMPTIPDYSKWTVKILNHPTNAAICFGIAEKYTAQNRNYNTWNDSYSTCFDTRVTQGLDHYKQTHLAYEIIDPMPSQIETLKGEIFDFFYKSNELIITNEYHRGKDGGRRIKARFELDPQLKFTPYINIYQPYVQIQVKGCSKKCISCVDWRPRQCLECSDAGNREDKPCCQCKFGFTDWYQYKINDKCITNQSTPISKYPEFEWENKVACTYCVKEQNKQGFFRVYSNHYFTLGLKDDKVLEGTKIWEVKVKAASSNGWVFLGIKRADINYTTSIGQYVGVITSSSVYHSVSYGALSAPTVLGKMPTDKTENIDIPFQVIYKPDLLQITNIEYGGEINYEFPIDRNVKFVPVTLVYGSEDTIQVQACNLQCQTCKDWNPHYCYTCRGANRIVAPTCGCQTGYTDIYHNEKHEDCIPIYGGDHPYPSNWQWKIYERNGNTNLPIDEGNGIYSKSNGYGSIYVNLGVNGLNGINGGTRWSIEFELLESPNSTIMFGVMSNEYLRSLERGEYGYDYFHGKAMYKHSGNTYGGYEVITTNVIEDETYTQDENIGMRYDLHYEDGFIKISNLAYGYHQHYEWELRNSNNFFPYIQLYSDSVEYTTKVNLKPCHWKCKTCNNSVSTQSCTSCMDLTTRNNDSSCSCKDGYYEDPEGFYKCLECDKSCETCSGPGTCLTCKLVANRINSPPECQCKIGYYSDVNFNCSPCNHQCSECEGSAEFCTKCKLEANRNQNNCQCNDGYYDDDFSGSCKPCPPQCRTCVDGSGICTDCACDRVIFDGTNTSCPCPDNSFGSNNAGSCQICEPPCSTCLDNNVCTACIYQGINRAGPPSCLCEPGFFEDEFHNCKTCIQGCAVCRDYAYRCIQCMSDPNRNQDPSNCSCKDGFMDDPLTGLCIKSSCPVKCDSCMAGSNVTCKVCAATLTRQGLETNCACNDGFYDDNEIDCKACQPPCGKCTSLEICETCLTSVGREPAPDCSCSTGYFEDESNNCIKCHYKCMTCENAFDNCTACKDQPNRKTTGDCACNSGYTEDTDSESCVAMATCHYKCSTCDLANPDVCTECSTVLNTNRKDKIQNCVCEDGYFDQGIPQCTQCGSLCATCDDISECSSCKYTGDDNRLGVPTCECKPGYKIDDQNKCVSENPVPDCPVEEGRSTDENCACIDGYFENDQDKCQKCADECATCDHATECLTCAEGYISDALPICYQCDSLCKACDTTGACTECVDGRENPPTCECKVGYLPHETKPICTFCDDKCLECSGTPQNCTICKGSMDFRYGAPECKCWEGFYDDNGICKRCDYKCITCEGAADHCLVCKNGEQRVLTPPSCDCEIGFYPTPYNNNCEYCSSQCQVTKTSSRLLFQVEELQQMSCSPQCKSCEKYVNYCVVCQPGRNTTMIPPKCECLQGYYQQEDNCLPCSYDCEKCTSISQCQKCKFDNMYPNLEGKCQCKKGYLYDKVTKGCQQCKMYQGKCLEFCPEGTSTLNGGNLCYTNEKLSSVEQELQQKYTQTIIYGVSGIVSLLVLTQIALKLIFKA